MDIEKVDPVLRKATQKFSGRAPSKAWMRAAGRLVTRVMPVPKFDDVTVTKTKADGVRVRIYQPDDRATDSGVLFWIHGGGLLYGDARQDEALCAETARELGILVVSANYRFAPEHPFPAALDDLWAAWGWMLNNASILGFNPSRIAVGGESAGGGLAASLVQRLKDAGGIQPIAQWLFAPMIDDRTAADESLDAIEHWVWGNRANRVGWTSYLAGATGAGALAPYAAAARREDLSGLPPAFIAVGDIELFLAENTDYAHRLEQAGVSVQLEVVTGAPHGFENWARNTKPARKLMMKARWWLQNALAAGPDAEGEGGHPA
jgi:acetyl esterase/lipase